jgi:ADP-ribose pyrophosphatase YjhB (NUDIX family)
MKFKYCPVCAGKLKDKPLEGDRIHPVCSLCGFVFFQNSKPTASAIIENEEGKIILAQRAIEPNRGKWDIPGGFLENGEEPIVGLKREIMEELSVEIEPIGISSIHIDKYDYRDEWFYTLNLYYKCRIASGEIKLDQENMDYKWLSLEQIPWNDLGFYNTTLALKSFFNIV